MRSEIQSTLLDIFTDKVCWHLSATILGGCLSPGGGFSKFWYPP